jgi:hypothetical protein
VYPDSWPSSSDRSEARKDQRIYFTFGLHPRLIFPDSLYYLCSTFRRLETWLGSTRTVAVGECGLDEMDRTRHRDLQKQIVYFEKQLHLALRLNLPVVVHSRGWSRIQQYTLDSSEYTSTLSSYSLALLHSLYWYLFFHHLLLRQYCVWGHPISPVRPLPEHTTGDPDLRHGQNCTGIGCSVYTTAAQVTGKEIWKHFPGSLHRQGDILGVSIGQVFRKTTENCVALYSLK